MEHTFPQTVGRAICTGFIWYHFAAYGFQQCSPSHKKRLVRDLVLYHHRNGEKRYEIRSLRLKETWDEIWRRKRWVEIEEEFVTNLQLNQVLRRQIPLPVGGESKKLDSLGPPTFWIWPDRERRQGRERCLKMLVGADEGERGWGRMRGKEIQRSGEREGKVEREAAGERVVWVSDTLTSYERVRVCLNTSIPRIVRNRPIEINSDEGAIAGITVCNSNLSHKHINCLMYDFFVNWESTFEMNKS